MKQVLTVVFFTLWSHALFAQTDTMKIEQYCQLIATPRLFSNKVTIDIDFGEEKPFWTDDRFRTYDGKLKKFNTIIDALNFMGKQGWVFINVYPVRNGSSDVYHYGFRKQFYRAEIKE